MHGEGIQMLHNQRDLMRGYKLQLLQMHDGESRNSGSSALGPNVIYNFSIILSLYTEISY